jgi:hypothetical protein
MTYTTSQDQTAHSQASLVQAFQNLEVDEQLALFWFIYTKMGESITPAAPGASTASAPIAEGLCNQIKEMSHQEQLQVQRDLVAQRDSVISREYSALSDTTKLLVWYLLAVEMDEGTIIPFPADYQLSSQAQHILAQIEQAEFNQQITFLRDIVAPMGSDFRAASFDSESGI